MKLQRRPGAARPFKGTTITTTRTEHLGNGALGGMDATFQDHD